MQYDVPRLGAQGPVPDRWEALPIGKAAVRRDGDDLTMVSVGVGVHRALEAAEALAKEGVSAGVIDLRTVCPLDAGLVCETVARSGRLLVMDEDYQGFGLSGELAAVVLEAGIPFKYARVCTTGTIPYARHLEDQALPNVGRIINAGMALLKES
jgi:pyruvate dehydrogenase E1 component beta subunit